MTAWMTFCRVGTGVAVFLSLLVTPFFSLVSAADEPNKSSKSPEARPVVSQLRSHAEAAEKAGDWEAAFTAYCHLFVADRSAQDVREKLNSALRRVQQLRRHRDPQFQRFVSTASVSDSLNLFGEVINKVPVLYIDRDRAVPQLLWENGIEELSRALGNPTFREAFLDNSSGDKSTEKLDRFRANLRTWAKQPIADARIARTTLRKLIFNVQEVFTVRVPSALVLEMVCGACSGLDEYTVFLTPSQLNPESASAIPDLSPQGIYLTFADDGLVVSGIAFGSWAAHHTSLRRGDRISRINGRSMEMATPAIAAEALLTATDGTHLLEIAATESESPVIQVPVTVPTVYGSRVLKEGVGYARIGSFVSSTPRELDDAIMLLKTQSGVRVMILDLRGNMGGSFLASVETAKRLIPNGLIVTTEGQLNEVANHTFSSDSGLSAHDIPIVVLIDAETASGAEVLAVALKDNNRATLIGMPTFGKGAIQYPLKLVSLDEVDEQSKPRTNRSATVRLTIAKLIAPRSGAINGVGISPHIFEADPEQQLILAVEKAIEILPSAPRMMIP